MSPTESMHYLTFGLMLVAAVVATGIAIERIVFAGTNLRRAKSALNTLDADRELAQDSLGSDVVSDLVRGLLSRRRQSLDASARQDLDDAAYIRARDALLSRLWILDTVVTAAPLLGLLGTIFGIVDTFWALSSSGMSDPASVSAGIGTALYATALGISIALCGLLAFNYLNDLNERICEHLKMLILRV